MAVKSQHPHPSSTALRLRLGLGLQGTQQKEPLLPTCFLFLCPSPGNGAAGFLSVSSVFPALRNPPSLSGSPVRF